MEQNKQNITLPDNAYRELKAGEEYKPLMSADTIPAEVTPYSVGMGVLMAIIFLLSVIPARCCTDPLIPQAIYNFGRTVTPV